MIQKILDIGIRANMPIPEQRKRRLLNFLAAVLLFIQPFAITLYIFEPNLWGIFFALLDGLSSGLILYFQFKGKFSTARIFLFVYYPLSLFIQIIALITPEIQLFWVTGLIGISFLFDESARLRKVFYVYIGMLMICSYTYMNYQLIKTSPTPEQLFSLLFTSGVVALLCISTYKILSFFIQNTEYFQKQTEEKNQEILRQNEEITQQAEYLEDMNKMKDRLFSIIAHDLRNPIVALRNTIDILDPNVLNTKELAVIKAELLKQFNGVDFTMNNLLTWTRGQMIGESISKESVNLWEVVESNAKLFETQLKTKELILVNCIPQRTEVYADLNHVRFVVRNLVNNAIKFSEKENVITIFSEEKQESIEIGIRDKGMGISREKQKKLFNIQTNYSTEGTAGERGTGLGLILCQEFIEKNGGKIWVESEIGKGSTFYFTLPKNETYQTLSLDKT
jgi:signal transduction histidine kinase